MSEEKTKNSPPRVEDTELKKYKGVYTNYAIYIDRHIPDIAVPYENPEIETKIHEYIYAICYVLSCKKHFFSGPNSVEDCKDFSHYAAEEFYIMFRDRYNNQGQIRMGKVVEPIKSSLNVIKRVLYAFKVEWAKKFFCQVYKSDWGEEGENQARKELESRRREAVATYVKEDVENSYNYRIVDAVTQTCNYLPVIIKKTVSNTPYRDDELAQSRLYKTCLLSFINSVTFPNSLLEKVEGNKISFDQLNKKYKKERDNCIILWHLEKDMIPYTNVILTRVREKFTSEIEGDVRDYSLDESTIDDILATAYTTYDTDQSDKEF